MSISPKDSQILAFGDLFQEVENMYSLTMGFFHQGEAKEKAATVDRMINLGMSDDLIMKICHVDADEVADHRQALEQRKQDEKALQKV